MPSVPSLPCSRVVLGLLAFFVTALSLMRPLVAQETAGTVATNKGQSVKQTAGGDRAAATEPTQSIRLHIYPDPRTLPSMGPGGGPNGNGANVNQFGGEIIDFWWTVAVNDKKTEKYLTETGFMAQILDYGDGKRFWRFTTTTPGQPNVDLPVGAWYTFEVRFHDNGTDGHLAATLSIDNDQKQRLYTARFDKLFQEPKTEQLGEIGYSWFTNIDTNVKKIFAWTDPRDEIIADKAELFNVATLFPAKLHGALQDAVTVGLPGTGDTTPKQWEVMATASGRLAKVYPVIRREVARIYTPPYPEEREAYIAAYTPAGRLETPRTMYLIKKADTIVPGFDMQAPAPTGSVRELVAFVADVPAENVEGGATLDKVVEGDWLFKEGADPQSILDRIALILAADYRINARFVLEKKDEFKKVRVEYQ